MFGDWPVEGWILLVGGGGQPGPIGHRVAGSRPAVGGEDVQSVVHQRRHLHPAHGPKRHPLAHEGIHLRGHRRDSRRIVAALTHDYQINAMRAGEGPLGVGCQALLSHGLAPAPSPHCGELPGP